MRITSSFALILGSLSLAACGGDDGGNTPIDAPPAIDAPAVTCSVSSNDFGDPGAFTGGVGIIDVNGAGVNDDVIQFQAALETTQPFDAVTVLLYAGYGAFSAGGIVPGTYQITGDELNFATCGVCVIIGTDYTSSGHTDDYMANGGSVTITEAGTAVGGNISGSVSNLTFHHVNIDETTGETTEASTCTTALDGGTFTATMQAPSGKPGQTSVSVPAARGKAPRH